MLALRRLTYDDGAHATILVPVKRWGAIQASRRALSLFLQPEGTVRGSLSPRTCGFSGEVAVSRGAMAKVVASQVNDVHRISGRKKEQLFTHLHICFSAHM
eukprot:2477022-Pleurochrysis_carterae.AAC.4